MGKEKRRQGKAEEEIRGGQNRSGKKEMQKRGKKEGKKRKRVIGKKLGSGRD